MSANSGHFRERAHATSRALFRARCDPEKVTGSKQFGMLYENCPIEFDSLSEFTQEEIRSQIGHQCSSEREAERTLRSYVRDLAKTPRLHLRNSHVRYAVSTLDHFRFLVSIGVEIVDVKHAILFASLSPESQALHPYRRTMGDLLERREAMQREKAELERVEPRTEEIQRQIDLLTTLIFLTKIR